MTTIYKWGPEFTVASEAIYPSVTALADGRFIAVAADNATQDVYGQFYNADGTEDGDPFLVRDLFDDPDYFLPYANEVTALADGGFLYSILEAAPFANTRTHISQVFGPDGTAEPEFITGDAGNAAYEAVTTELADGRFLSLWTTDSGGLDSDGHGIYGRFFNRDGTPSGDAFLVNTTTTDNQFGPQATILANGGFVVTWNDGSQSPDDPDGNTTVRAQVYDPDGNAVGNEFLVPTETTGKQDGPAVAALANGRFVITWIDNSGQAPDTDGSAIRAQVYNADGTPVGGEFVVNTTTTNTQVWPDIAALPGGGFVIVWGDSSQTGHDTDGTSIRGQQFDGSGNPVGGEFSVNATTEGSQTNPELKVLTDGRFLVSYTSGGDVLAQIFDPRDEAVSFSGSGLDDQFVGTIFGDTLLGRSGDDLLIGEAGQDIVVGGRGEDLLRGGADNDTIDGGRHRDDLFGGAGGDLFVFDHLKDSHKKTGRADTIHDFNSAEGDIIDLSGIDARKGGRDNDFKFIGTSKFHDKKGELRIKETADKVFVKGDVKGNGKADFSLVVKDTDTLAVDDFVL